ncbi:MAG: ISL3 family transposase [Acidimicrobiia bacterium]|nr:ISL3 family transposase [Acidimicrobiia bacterium]
MRVTTAFKRLLDLPGVTVSDVEFAATTVVVTVGLRRRRLECPECGYSTPARYDSRPVDSRWRHLDLGVWRLEVRARLRRLVCPAHGVRTEGVPFARPGSEFSGDFEALVAWLATRTDKTAITKLVRINWRTVGRIVERVVADELDPGRLDGLFEIGVDEISWRKHHNYLTLVADHHSGKVVWGAEGRDATTLDGFFDELGTDRSAQLTAVSMDMGPAFAKSVRADGHAPQATICLDPFHVVALGTKALDEVRRPLWQQMRQLPDPGIAKRFKGARWALLKNPDDLTDTQAVTLTAIRRNGGAMWRAYKLKEALRAIFAGDLTETEASDMIDRWCSWAQRSRLQPFIKLARTIRAHRDGILAAIRLGLTNGRVEGLNNRVRLIVRRGFGFHTAGAALALVMLTCGPIELELPHQHRPAHPHR